MTQPADPHVIAHWDRCALVTIDMQRDFLSDSPYGLAGTTEVIPQLRQLGEAFRAGRRPIIHIVRLYERGGGNAERSRRALLANGAELVTPGSVGSQLADGLAPQGAPDLDPALLMAGEVQPLGVNEYAIFKPRWGAFYQTPLQDLLTELGVDTIVFAGCNFPNCPRASIVEASERDYRIVLATDAISQATPQGFADLRRIGVNLHSTPDILAALHAHSST
jgi:nicotinamidase-related amidase